MTNYENIKNMSIEQMAKFIREVASCDCACCPQELYEYCNNDCIGGAKEYLESEVTNDN